MWKNPEYLLYNKKGGGVHNYGGNFQLSFFDFGITLVNLFTFTRRWFLDDKYNVHTPPRLLRIFDLKTALSSTVKKLRGHVVSYMKIMTKHANREDFCLACGVMRQKIQ